MMGRKDSSGYHDFTTDQVKASGDAQYPNVHHHEHHTLPGMRYSLSRLTGILLCGTALVCIAIPIAPHFIRVLSPEHRIVVETGTGERNRRKLTTITPAEVRRLIARIKKDTIIIHLWNTWRSDGTRYVRTLKGYSSRTHPKTAVVHICTDMTGIQQQKASRMIAARLDIPGPLLCVRSTASIFDLHNIEATIHFHRSLTGKVPDTVSPSVLALNKDGIPIELDGAAGRTP